MFKKSQSEVVSTVFLVLIVLTAVFVVWVVVNYFLSSFRDNDRLLCSRVKLSIVEAKDRGVGNYDTVMVTRSGEGEEGDVTGIKFTVNGKGAEVIQVEGTNCDKDDATPEPECDLSLGIVETKTVTLGLPFVAGDEIGIAAMVGENKFVCDISDMTRATSA